MKWIEIYPIDNTTVVHCIYHLNNWGLLHSSSTTIVTVLTLNKKHEQQYYYSVFAIILPDGIDSMLVH